MNPISILARLLLAAAAILGLASCMSYEPPLRIALIRWPPFEFLHLAQEKGYFAAEGVEVRLIEFVAVNDTQRAFEHDKIDGGTFSLFQVLQNRDQLKRKMQVPLVIDFSDGADLLLARPEIADVREPARPPRRRHALAAGHILPHARTRNARHDAAGRVARLRAHRRHGGSAARRQGRCDYRVSAEQHRNRERRPRPPDLFQQPHPRRDRRRASRSTKP